MYHILVSCPSLVTARSKDNAWECPRSHCMDPERDGPVMSFPGGVARSLGNTEASAHAPEHDVPNHEFEVSELSASSTCDCRSNGPHAETASTQNDHEKLKCPPPRSLNQ